MKIKINEFGYIDEFALIGDLDGEYIEIDFSPDEMFYSKFNSYKYNNGKLEYNNDKYAENVDNQYMSELRRQREIQCFPVINRGQLWYDSLSIGQYLELKDWYKDWLDVTETKIIPDRLEWIK